MSLLCVADGCGGLGSRRYAELDGQTGAHAASRVATQSVKRWAAACRCLPKTPAEGKEWQHSLQETLESDEASSLTLADVLQDSFCMEEVCEKQAEIRRARLLLDGLPARERQIILLRYGLAGQPPLTQLEVAGLLNISRSYVSRLETHALELLRQRWNAPDTKTAQR